MQLTNGSIASPRRKGEPTIALINIVFLMLIFFLVAAQVAPPLDRDLTLIETQELEGQEPPDTLVIRANGDLAYRGALITLEDYLSARQMENSELDTIRLVPDRGLSATRLIEIGNNAQRLGISRVLIVTRRGLNPQ